MDRSLILALSYCDFLKTHEKLKIFKSFSSLKEFTSSSIVDISVLLNRRLNTKFNLASLEGLVEKALNVLKFYSIKMIMIEEEDFPPQLKEIPDPPFSIFVRGNIQGCGFNMLSVVGTRYPTGEGIRMAFYYEEPSHIFLCLLFLAWLVALTLFRNVDVWKLMEFL